MKARTTSSGADQHLERRFDDGGSHCAQPLPWILFQRAHLGGKGPAAPGIEGVVADVVQGLRDRQYVLQLQAALQQALLRVTQHGLGDQDPGHGLIVCPVFQAGFCVGPAGPHAPRSGPRPTRAALQCDASV
jgi:hypothetical protein